MYVNSKLVASINRGGGFQMLCMRIIFFSLLMCSFV